MVSSYILHFFAANNAFLENEHLFSVVFNSDYTEYFIFNHKASEISSGVLTP
jgi:hypothetical protein